MKPLPDADRTSKNAAQQVPAAAAPSAAAAKATPGSAPKPPLTPAAADADADAGKGFAVQVAAVRDRAEAERIAGRLRAKGYPTYITSPAPGMFRVRVGKFQEQREADSAAAKLEKEEQFKPWITK